MRSICLVVAAVLVAVPAHATTPAWTIQVDPLTFALGFAHVQIERAVAPQWSVYAGPSMRGYDGLIDKTPQPFRGYGIELGLRRFVSGTAPAGSWLEVRGVAAYLKADAPRQDSGFGGYASVLGGHTWVVAGWLVLAAGLGVQYLDYRVAGFGVHGVLPAAHTTLGVAF